LEERKDDDMTQHFYGDVSNLNAPYDAIAVQGLGQAEPFPWREESSSTRDLQLRLNPMLDSIGKCILLVDGVMGPRTCGAMIFLNQEFSAGRFPEVPPMVSICNNPPETPIMPSNCPTGQPEAPPPEPPAPIEPVAPKKGGIPIWIWGAGIAVVAIGAAFMFKKKR
jgi:hypothetical protein